MILFELFFCFISAYIVLNFKEEVRCVGIKKMCKLFTVFFNFSLVILYILIEIILSATDDHEKISHTGHFCGLLSGFVVGFIVLDNRKKDAWESITGRVLIILYAIVFFGMMLVHMSRTDYLDDYCLDCKKSIHNILKSTRNASECNTWTSCGKNISALCPDPCLRPHPPNYCPSQGSPIEL